MIRTICVLGDGQGSLCELSCLGEPSILPVDLCQIVQFLGHIWMVLSKRLLFQRQGPLVESQRLSILTLAPVQVSQSVQADQHIQIISPWSLFSERKRSL